MPYVVVKRTKCKLSRNEVAVAPDCWVQRNANGTTFVSMPKLVCSQKISELLRSERVPTAEWEKHECEVLCTNIATLEMAYTIIESMQKQGAMAKLSALPTKAPIMSKEIQKVGNQIRANESRRKMTALEKIDHSYDPFVDIHSKPFPAKRPTVSSPVESLQMTVEEGEPISAMWQFFSSVTTKDTQESIGRVVVPLEEMTTADEKLLSKDNVKSTASSKEADRQRDTQDNISMAELFDLLHEIKRMIQSNQTELRRKVNEGFQRLQKSMLDALRDRFAKDNTIEPTDSLSLPFQVKPVSCREEIDELESRLKDEAYWRKVIQWINAIVASDVNPETRMINLLEKLIDRTFVTQLGWNLEHRYQQIRLASYKNFCKLFEHAGTTGEHRADARCVEIFFRKKLSNSHTQTNLHGKHSSEADRNSLKRNRSEWEQDQGDLGIEKITESETISTPASAIKAEDVHQVIELDSEDESVSTTTEVASSASEYVEVNAIDCLEGLNDFEKRLEEPDYLVVVHGWIDQTVGSLAVPDERMDEILDRLVDRTFLRNFDWSGTVEGKQALMNFNNFVHLFEYIGTTAQHRADHRYVARFFQTKFDTLSTFDNT